ncbi:MAG: glycosyl transferase, partial [Nitrospirota bacterium]
LEKVTVQYEKMLAIFREGVKSLGEIWIDILGQGDYGQLQQIASLPDKEFVFPAALWARIIYDYAIAHHTKKITREHLLKSLTPLYLGKTASFVREAEQFTHEESEEAIERLCILFEDNKELLINAWK